MSSARVAGPPVVFGVNRLGEDNRSLVAELLDQDVVTGRKINVVGRIAAAGGAHILGVEGVFEGESHPVHRHQFQVRVTAVSGVQFRRPFQGIG